LKYVNLVMLDNLYAPSETFEFGSTYLRRNGAAACLSVGLLVAIFVRFAQPSGLLTYD
jgi:hypothetical protein